MVQDFNVRLERTFAFREENGIPVDLFVGEPDAYAALRNLPVFVCNSHRGHLMTVTIAGCHPSAGIMSGDPTVQRDIRDQFAQQRGHMLGTMLEFESSDDDLEDESPEKRGK
jgi:hypothetical protein